MSKEKLFETKAKKKVKAMGGDLIKFFSASHRGRPDRLCVIPRAKGRIWWVEFKDDGLTFEPHQKVEADRLAAMGQQVRLVNSEASLENFLKEMEDFKA